MRKKKNNPHLKTTTFGIYEKNNELVIEWCKDAARLSLGRALDTCRVSYDSWSRQPWCSIYEAQKRFARRGTFAELNKIT